MTFQNEVPSPIEDSNERDPNLPLNPEDTIDQDLPNPDQLSVLGDLLDEAKKELNEYLHDEEVKQFLEMLQDIKQNTDKYETMITRGSDKYSLEDIQSASTQAHSDRELVGKLKDGGKEYENEAIRAIIAKYHFTFVNLNRQLRAQSAIFLTWIDEKGSKKPEPDEGQKKRPKETAEEEAAGRIVNEALSFMKKDLRLNGPGTSSIEFSKLPAKEKNKYLAQVKTQLDQVKNIAGSVSDSRVDEWRNVKDYLDKKYQTYLKIARG